ncbi:hypothetical protein [Actinokineospora spheciospongiae]|nr:hypothetical protein [Actinokineospora spheciospongiae]
MLVFLKDGAVQRATFTTPDLLRDDTYAAPVRLRARGCPALIDIES